MYKQNLDLLHSTRAETLRLCSAITQAQSEFAPPGKWSAGEVLHNLLLADDLYRGNCARLIALQKSGQPVSDLRAALQSSYDEMAAMFNANPDLDYRAIRYQHPIMGSNNVLQMLRIAALHERRHQSQIQDLLRLPQFSKVA